MSWFTILKQPRLVNVQSTGLKTTKPELSNEKEDGPCNRKLKEYANKLKGTPLHFKELWENKVELELLDSLWTDISGKRQEHWYADNVTKDFSLMLKPHPLHRGASLTSSQPSFRTAGGEQTAFETITHLYGPIPEEVACKALDMLHGKHSHWSRHQKFNDWLITVFNTDNSTSDAFGEQNDITLRIAPRMEKAATVFLSHYRGYSDAGGFNPPSQEMKELQILLGDAAAISLDWR
mgnify:CR=1 FL=1